MQSETEKDYWWSVLSKEENLRTQISECRTWKTGVQIEIAPNLLSKESRIIVESRR